MTISSFFLLRCTSSFAKQLWDNSGMLQSQKIIFYGDHLIQNVIVFLEIGQGSLKPPNDSLLKNGLVVSQLAPCPK